MGSGMPRDKTHLMINVNLYPVDPQKTTLYMAFVTTKGEYPSSVSIAEAIRLT